MLHDFQFSQSTKSPMSGGDGGLWGGALGFRTRPKNPQLIT